MRFFVLKFWSIYADDAEGRKDSIKNESRIKKIMFQALRSVVLSALSRLAS